MLYVTLSCKCMAAINVFQEEMDVTVDEEDALKTLE